jgi:hypothetical protein
MFSRRAVLGCFACLPAADLFAATRPSDKAITFCASAVDMADADMHSSAAIDWDAFFIGDVRELLSQCFRAYGASQRVFFTDQAPLQASFNHIDPDDVAASRICIGVGNLGLYPYCTLIAVILHELGHYFSYRSRQWPTIEASAEHKQIELLADYLAGAAFARMEGRNLKVAERVFGQCSELILPWLPSRTRPAPIRRRSNAVVLDPRKLVDVGQGKVKFDVLRPDGMVEPLESYAMIGTMPDEDPFETKCMATHDRSLNFLAMVGAVSTWRTFGDRPETESHGSPVERYDAFSFGYTGGRRGRPLKESLIAGMSYLRIAG